MPGVTPEPLTRDDGHMSAPQQSDGDPARDATTPRAVITAGLPSQLVDTDPDETQEWVDSLDAVIDHAGRTRARYLMLQMRKRGFDALQSLWPVFVHFSGRVQG